jgi:zinc protease
MILLTTMALAMEPVVWEDEGTSVVLVEDHRQPLVELRFQLPAGSAHPWFADAHLEEAWDNLLYDPEGALRARADALSVDLYTSAGSRSSTLGLSCLKADLPDAMTLVSDVLANRSFDKDELKRTGQGRKLGWKSSQKDPNWRLQQAAVQLFFAPGDVRMSAWEEPASVKKSGIGAELSTLVGLPGRILGMAGNITRDEAQLLIEGILPPVVAAPEGLELTVDAPLADQPEQLVVPMENLTQAYLAVVRVGLTLDDPDFPAWKVANHVLAGHFYSRMYVALRHEGGETYGVGSWFSPRDVAMHYGLWTFTRADNVDVTMDKLRGTMETFRAEGLTDDELTETQGYFRGRLQFGQQSPGQVLDRAMSDLARGVEVGFSEQVVEAIEGLQLEDVNAFVADFYAADAFTEVLVQPE